MGADSDLEYDFTRHLLGVTATGVDAWAGYEITEPNAFLPGTSYVFAADVGCDASVTGDLELDIHARSDGRVRKIFEEPFAVSCGPELQPVSWIIHSMPEPFAPDPIGDLLVFFDWANEGPEPSGTLLVDNVSYTCFDVGDGV